MKEGRKVYEGRKAGRKEGRKLYEGSYVKEGRKEGGKGRKGPPLLSEVK